MMVDPSPSSPIRIAIVEDNPVYRSTLQALLESTPGFVFVAAFERAASILERIDHYAGQPPWDLVVMDIDLPEMSGIEATRRVKAAAPALPVVNLTVFDEPATILLAICAGADGYLLKSTPADELLDQLLAVTRGGSPLTPNVARTILDLVRSEASAHATTQNPLTALSDREQEVLVDLARGLVCKQVAANRGISLHTVRTYIRRIYEKLQVRTIAEAVATAIRSGLV
jgi:DNA-binding NarL/FixJ family response regulator